MSDQIAHWLALLDDGFDALAGEGQGTLSLAAPRGPSQRAASSAAQPAIRDKDVRLSRSRALPVKGGLGCDASVIALEKNDRRSGSSRCNSFSVKSKLCP
jgi:hypothetical protein